MPTRRENGKPMPLWNRGIQLNDETWKAIRSIGDKYSLSETETVEMILEWVGTSKQRRRWLGLHGEAVVAKYRESLPKSKQGYTDVRKG